MCIYFLFNIYCSVLIYMVIMIVTYIKVYISTLFWVAVYFKVSYYIIIFKQIQLEEFLFYTKLFQTKNQNIYIYINIVPKENGLFYFWECNTLLHLDLHHLDNDLQSLSQSFIQYYCIHLPKIWQVSADFYWYHWQKTIQVPIVCLKRDALYRR